MHTTGEESGMARQQEWPDPAAALVYFQQKSVFTMTPAELRRRIMEGADLHVIDVREREEYDRGHIPGAVNLPKDKWYTLAGLTKDKANVLYCYSQVCHLAATAAVEFASKGFPVMELEGGWDEWKDHGLEIET
jgi:rhodanese-related sulfurtransferase